MKVKYDNGTTEYGHGVSIGLNADEVAIVIDEYIKSKKIEVYGPRTITVNWEKILNGRVYVDPMGWVKALYPPQLNVACPSCRYRGIV